MIKIIILGGGGEREDILGGAPKGGARRVGPHPAGPHPSGPHPSEPHPSGPHNTCPLSLPPPRIFIKIILKTATTIFIMIMIRILIKIYFGCKKKKSLSDYPSPLPSPKFSLRKIGVSDISVSVLFSGLSGIGLSNKTRWPK